MYFFSMQPLKASYSFVICLFFAIAAMAQTATAQTATSSTSTTNMNYEIESDAADRIVLASKLRTLTQQVAAASCAVTSDINVSEAHEVLEEATGEFDRYIVALRDGDQTLHILEPEKSGRILRDIEHLRTEWMAIHRAIDSVLVNEDDDDASHLIDDHNLKLLELTTILQSDISGRYANPYEMTAADAMMVDIAGRQLMLTQKMAKDSCEVWTGYNAEAAREDLRATMQTFEVSLNALRDGMPSAGLQPAPTEKIRDDLDILLRRWSVIRVNQQTLVDGGELDEAQKAEIFHDLQLELEDLRTLLYDYREYAERNHAG